MSNNENKNNIKSNPKDTIGNLSDSKNNKINLISKNNLTGDKNLTKSS